MKLPRNCLIESVFSTSPTRLPLTAAHLNKEKGLLIATNGIALISMPVQTGEHDASGYVTKEALKAARKSTPRGATHAEMTANGQFIMPDGSTLPRPTSDHLREFPNTDFITDSAREGDVRFKLRLNAAMLLQLADAMGSEAVEIEIRGDSSPLVVLPFSSRGLSNDAPEGTFGILCPIRGD